MVHKNKKLSSFLSAAHIGLLAAALSVPPAMAGTTRFVYGDKDGFGYADLAGLVNGSGAPIDTNGNGVLEPGESLPDLSADGRVDPAGDDAFNNRDGDLPNTDAGFVAMRPVEFSFAFALPADTRLTGATFRIVLSDGSFRDRQKHVILLDGESTGVEIVPRGPAADGEITETVVEVSKAMLAAVADGAVTFSVVYSADAVDDIAIDFAELSLRTLSTVEAAGGFSSATAILFE